MPALRGFRCTSRYGLFAGSRSFWDAPMAVWSWWLSWAILGLALGASYDAERRLEPAWFERTERHGSPLARA